MVADRQLRFKKLKYQIDEFERRLNKEQRYTDRLIEDKTLTIVSGKAGSGKTLISCFSALRRFAERKIDNIVITRPTVSTEDNGFLPGGIEEKLDPWVSPIHSCMKTVLKDVSQNPHTTNSLEMFEQLMNTGIVEIVPLTYMRGRTFTNSFVIVDEAQNLTMEQTMMVISRIGIHSKMVICGDLNQIDLRKPKDSGMYFLNNMEEDNLVGRIKLQENHRHEIVDNMLKKYERMKSDENVHKVLHLPNSYKKVV
jgi:phosphate starvation-inducible PhoH-like protein